MSADLLAISEPSNDEVYMLVMRHGNFDANDAIAEEDKNKILNTAQTINNLGLNPDLIYTSVHSRNKHTARLLRTVFGNSAQDKTQDLENIHTHTQLSSVFDFISSAHGKILFSGHSETIDCFAGFLLKPIDCEKLFRVLPSSRMMTASNANGLYHMLHPRHADVLILKAKRPSKEELNKLEWSLMGYVADAQYLPVHHIDEGDIAQNVGRKQSLLPRYPSLVYYPEHTANLVL